MLGKEVEGRRKWERVWSVNVDHVMIRNQGPLVSFLYVKDGRPSCVRLLLYLSRL